MDVSTTLQTLIAATIFAGACYALYRTIRSWVEAERGFVAVHIVADQGEIYALTPETGTFTIRGFLSGKRWTTTYYEALERPVEARMLFTHKRTDQTATIAFPDGGEFFTVQITPVPNVQPQTNE